MKKIMLLIMAAFLAVGTSVYAESKIEKKVDDSYMNVSYALLQTHPLITDYGDLGDKVGKNKYVKEIDIELPSPEGGTILVPCKRTIKYGLKYIIVKAELDTTNGPIFELNDFTYSVALYDNKVVYYLDAESDYVSQFKIAAAFRVHTKKHHDALIDKLEELHEKR